MSQTECLVNDNPIKVLTKEDIKQTFSIADYAKLVKQCSLIEMKDNKQHYSIWLKDKCNEIHLLLKDKSSKSCTYLGCLEGIKFDVVLENSFFDSIKDYLKEGKNEDDSSGDNRFSTSVNSSVLSGEKVSA
jgi:hypothetical protein